MTPKGAADNNQVEGNLLPNPSSTQEVSEVWKNTLEGIEDLRILNKEISDATAKMEQFMKALTTIFRSLENRQLLDNLIAALNKMENDDLVPSLQAESDNKSEKKEEKGKTQSETQNQPFNLPVSKDGDSLFDIINSPSFLGIVDKVMQHKKRPRL